MHSRFKQSCCFILVIFMLMISGCTKEKAEVTELQKVEVKDKEESDSADQKEEELYVHVCGQVVNPGVYKLPDGSRIYEAIDAAGGTLDAAAAESLNLAEKLNDGQQIYIPSVDEAGAVAAGAGDMGSNDGKVNLNTAAREELMTLSGIGEAKADSIIRYREEHGGFKSIEELKEVEGIKDGVFNKVKDQIKV